MPFEHGGAEVVFNFVVKRIRYFKVFCFFAFLATANQGADN